MSFNLTRELTIKRTVAVVLRRRTRVDGKEVKGSPARGGACEAAEAERWEKTFHAVGEGIFIVDREFRILQANEAFAGLVGARPEDLVGTECFRLVHGTAMPPETCVIGCAVREGTSARAELFEPNLDKHLAVSVDPSFDTRGEFEFAVHTARDITGQKRAEQELASRHGLLESLIEAMPNPVFFKDTSGVYLGCNHAFEAYIGRSRDEVVGKTVYDISPKELADVYREADEKLLANPGTQVYESRVEYADGSLHDVIFTKATFTDSTGHVGGIVGLIVDITESRRAERGLLSAEKRLRELTETLPQVVFETDSTGTITYVNRKGYELFGYTEDDFREGISALRVIDPVDHERLAGAIGKMMDGRSDGALREYTARRRDGSTFPCTAETTLVTDEEGNRIGIRGILTDITERRRGEEERAILIHDLGERVKELNSLYGLSRLVEKPGISLDEILQGTVELLPASYQYPENISVLLKLGGKEYVTANHRETPWRLSSDINVHGMKEGELEVSYLGQRPEADEDPFLAEERDLIAAVAERLGRIIERKRTEEARLESEERMRIVLEASPFGMILVGEDRRIADINKTALELTGYARDELIGKICNEWVCPRAHDKCPVYDLGEDVSNLETVVINRHGERISVLKTAVPISISGQRFVLEMIADITERKRAEESLRESEERMRTILEASPFGMILVGEDRRILDINRAASKLTGYSREELIGKVCHEFICPGEEGTCPIYDFGLEVSNRETTMLNRYGESISALKTAVPITISGKRVLLEMIADITEQKRAEEDLQHINAELEGFAHTVSHDLKGPLAAIKSAGETLETLVEMPLTDETKADIVEMAEVISEGADRSTALINDVLALAAAGRAPVDVGEVDVGEVVSRVVTERDAVITEKGIRVECSSNLGLVHANPTHIYQVFTNLIGNAIKHNDSASPVISVSYLGEDRTGGRRYLVRDNGSGITPGNLKKVFIPFFKGATGETGIGLSTVEKIVKIYGGRIRAYNDGGACFEFVLRDYAEDSRP